MQIQLTPGYQFDTGEKASRASLNLLGKPSVQLQGQVEHADIDEEAVWPNNVKVAPYFYVAATGTADALLATLNPALATLTDGVLVAVKAASANTGAATLNVNGLGAKDIRKKYNQALAAGDLVAGGIYEFRYDATNSWWQMISPTANTLDAITWGKVFAQGVASANTLGTSSTNIGAITLALPAGKVWTHVRIVLNLFFPQGAAATTGMNSLVAKIGVDTLSLVSTAPPETLTINNSDDGYLATFILEGAVHASHLSDASLVIDLYSSTADATVVDKKTSRALYAVAEYMAA